MIFHQILWRKKIWSFYLSSSAIFFFISYSLFFSYHLWLILNNTWWSTWRGFSYIITFSWLITTNRRQENYQNNEIWLLEVISSVKSHLLTKLLKLAKLWRKSHAARHLRQNRKKTLIEWKFSILHQSQAWQLDLLPL